MKKPSEMTVGLLSAVVAVASAMWMDTATAQDRSTEQTVSSDSATRTDSTTQKKRKPTASEVSSGKAAEPSKDPVEDAKKTAQEVDEEFREGYGGSGDVDHSTGKSDATDVGRNVRNAEEATKEMGKDVTTGVKEADKGFRSGYHEEKMTQDPATTGSRTDDRAQRKNESRAPTSGAASDPQSTATPDDRTDMGDIGHELGKSARRLEEATIEAVDKIRGEAKEAEEGFEEGYGGSGTPDGGTGKAEVKLKGMGDGGTMGTADGGTPSKLQIKLKTGTDGGTK